MAKRGAEALLAPGPARFQGYFPRAPRPKRARSDLEWREPRGAAPRREKGNGHKRKRGAMESESEAAAAAAAAAKRPAGPEGSGGAQKEPPGGPFPDGAAPEQQLQQLARRKVEAAAAASGDNSDGCLAPKRPEEEHEDDAWHYNSFQYWRCPLPAIDLCDILDLEKDGMLEAGDFSSVALSEMET